MLTLVLFACPVLAQRTPVETREPVLEFSGGDSLFKVARAHPFDDVRDLQPLSNGGIVVLTRTGLHYFDGQGRLTRRIDGASVGRGGFVNATGFDVSALEVTVRDEGAQQWKTYTTEGRLVGARPIPGDVAMRRIPMRGGAYLIEQSPSLHPVTGQPPADQSFTRTVSIQLGSAPPTRLLEVRVDSVYFRPGYDTLAVQTRAMENARRTARPVPSRFGAGGAWLVRGDSEVVHVDGGTGAVNWYAIGGAGAEVSQRGHLGRSSRPVTPADVAEENARLQRLAVAAAPAAYRDARRISAPFLSGAAAYWSVATRAMYADDGALWVGVNRIYTDSDERGEYLVRIGDENTWTVFPSAGPAYTVTLRARFRLTAIRNGRLYGFVDSGAGTPVVEMYSVRAPRQSDRAH